MQYIKKLLENRKVAKGYLSVVQENLEFFYYSLIKSLYLSNKSLNLLSERFNLSILSIEMIKYLMKNKKDKKINQYFYELENKLNLNKNKRDDKSNEKNNTK